MADIKRLDAGSDILISGSTREEVEAALQELLAGGAKLITPVSQVGRAWVAACAPRSQIDDTSTLYLSQVAAAQRQRHPEAALCGVEEVGLKRIVTGPSREAVDARTAELVAEGAEIVSGPEESYGSWIAVCDTGGRIKP